MRRIIVLALFSAASCVRYTPGDTEIKTAAKWKQSFSTTPSAIHEDNEAWWQIFQDKDLNHLQEIAITSNATIKDRILRLEEAEAIYVSSRSSLFPAVDLIASATRKHLPQSGSALAVPVQIPPSPPATTPINTTISTSTPRNQSMLRVAPSLSYELDFWGKLSQYAQAAHENIHVSEEEIQIAHLLTSTEVAKLYFEIRSCDEELSILDSLYQIAKQQVLLYTQRVNNGLENESRLLNAQAVLAQRKADIASLKAERAYAENGLAVLLGKNPSEFHILPAIAPLKVPSVPVGLPASLLEKRPDLKQARHEIEQMRLLVGVAKTAFFPQITLYADAGYQSNTRASLWKWKNHILSGTADLLMPLYNAGKTQAEVDAAIARYKQAVNGYVLQTQTAFQEVENALTAIETAKQTAQLIYDEYLSQENNEKITYERYRQGLLALIDTASDANTVLEAKRRFVQAHKQQLLAAIDLIKSMGGSWVVLKK